MSLALRLMLIFSIYPVLSRIQMKLGALTTISILFLSSAATAQQEDDWQSWPLADRFTVRLDAFFPSLDTRVRVDASDGEPGTTVDFEQNLGMSDTENLPSIGFGWRFAKKHQVALEGFVLDRSGSSITTSEIRFGDEVFVVDLPISSFFDMNIVSLNYSYSLIFDEKKELAFAMGLSVQDIKFGIFGNAGLGIIASESGITAPLPTFGLRGAYAFTDKWIGRFGIGILSLDLALSDEDELGGEVLQANASVQHNTFENVHFALSYNYFDVRFDYTTDLRTTSIGYQYHGPAISVVAAF